MNEEKEVYVYIGRNIEKRKMTVFSVSRNTKTLNFGIEKVEEKGAKGSKAIYKSCERSTGKPLYRVFELCSGQVLFAEFGIENVMENIKRRFFEICGWLDSLDSEKYRSEIKKFYDK